MASRRRGPRLHECSIEFEVPFHDIDALRVVWHGHYYKYMELGRTRLFRNRKIDADDLVALRCAFVVIDSGCRYVSPLRYGDRVRVDSWFRDVTHRIYVAYELTNLTAGVRAARGHTALVTTTWAGEMLYRTPSEILERVAPSPIELVPSHTPSHTPEIPETPGSRGSDGADS